MKLFGILVSFTTLTEGLRVLINNPTSISQLRQLQIFHCKRKIMRKYKKKLVGQSIELCREKIKVKASIKKTEGEMLGIF